MPLCQCTGDPPPAVFDHHPLLLLDAMSLPDGARSWVSYFALEHNIVVLLLNVECKIYSAIGYLAHGGYPVKSSPLPAALCASATSTALNRCPSDWEDFHVSRSSPESVSSRKQAFCTQVPKIAGQSDRPRPIDSTTAPCSIQPPRPQRFPHSFNTMWVIFAIGRPRKALPRRSNF